MVLLPLLLKSSFQHVSEMNERKGMCTNRSGRESKTMVGAGDGGVRIPKDFFLLRQGSTLKEKK